MITNGRVQLWPFLRVALFLVVGVLIGDALDCRVPSCVWMWAYVALLSAFVASYFFLHKHPIFQTVVLFIMVVAGGLWRTTCFLEDYNVSFSDAPETFEAVVETQPVEKERSVKCQLAVTKGRLAGHSIIAFFPKKDYQYEDDGTGVNARQLVIGDGLVVCSRLEKAEWVRRTADKGRDSHFDYGRWLKVHDVIARTYVPYGSCARKVLSLNSLSMPKRLSIVLDRVRRKAMTHLAAYGVSDDAYGIVGAMTLGDKTALSDAARETYSVVGVSHVLALSGLHLGIIFMLLAAILIPFGSSMGRLIIGNLVLILSIWAYALMVGMSSSIVRSAVMYTCFAFFGLMSAKPQSLNSLGIAVVVLVLGNPMSLWDVGFQMSFLAVFGILAFNERFHYIIKPRYLQSHRMVDWIWTMFKVSMAAQVMVAPIIIYYFGRFSCYFLLANYIAIPAVTLIVYLSLVFYIMAFVGLPFFPRLIAYVLDRIVVVLNASLDWIAAIPGASIDNISFSGTQLVLVYVAITLFFCLSYYLEDMYRSAYGYKIM